MRDLKSFILSFIAIICVAIFGSAFTSCTNDDDILVNTKTNNPSDYISVEYIKLDSVQPPITRSINSVLTKVNQSKWGSYTRLYQATGNGTTLSSGIYAVKFTRKSGAPNSVTVRTYALGMASTCESYAWNYLFASDNTQIYATTPVHLTGTNIYDYYTTITGSQYAVFVLQVINSGTYYVEYFDN